MGVTAGQHMWKRTKLMPLMFLAAVGVAIPPPGAIGRVVMFASIVGVGLLMFLYLRIARQTVRRQQGERALGYTTVWRTARDQPGLWLLHDKTKEVVAGPFQPRPANTRKSTMEAWMQERRGKGSFGTPSV